MSFQKFQAHVLAPSQARRGLPALPAPSEPEDAEPNEEESEGEAAGDAMWAPM